METPALHKYGLMPRIALETASPVARLAPPSWSSSGPKFARRIAFSPEPRGSIRRIVGISVAVALTLLLFVAGGSLFPGLLENDGVLLGFTASLFLASVVAGYVVSGLSIRNVIAL